MTETTPLPLDGIRILDLTRLLPGAWASMMLADYGADVVKIEQPGRGDYSRWAVPTYRYDSVYFANVNRNKRSMTLNLRAKAGRQIFFDLVKQADIVLESYRPGVAARLGIDYERVTAVNPRIIYCSVTGFGQTGPYRDQAGHDLNIAGLAGFLNVRGDNVHMPGIHMADFAGAVMTVIALLLALLQRNRTGRGQYLDVAMFDSLISWMSITATSHFARLAGFSGEPKLAAFGENPRYNIYRTSDNKYVSVSILEKPFWEKLCRLLGREDLIADEEDERDRLTDHGERGKQYHAFLAALFATGTRDEWVSKLLAEGIPCFPVYTPDEVFSDPQVHARQMLRWLTSPAEGSIPQLGFPIKSSTMEPRLRLAPPRLGEHTDAVLAELGYTEEDRSRLRAEGVV